jgi:TRAP-type C4-dicarboxylate transport system substrate-binding protein
MAQKKTAARLQMRVAYGSRRASVLAAASLATLLVAAGCGSASDKAGGTVAAAPVELRLVNPRGDEAQPFLDELAQLSGGTLHITGNEKFENAKVTAEVDALHVVQSGQADIAFVPTRAYDFIGVKSFDALMDPMLIDNMELQQQVLTDPIASEMLSGVNSAGLTGIGVLPGPIRLPDGITRRLLGPTTYAGARIAYSPSPVASRSLQAVGTTPVESEFEGADISGFDGLELQARSVAGNQYDGEVRWITANVGLWPRPVAIVANTGSWGKLSQTQQGWLVEAAKAALPATVALQNDTEDIANMCRRNQIKIISAADADASRLREAFKPVDRWLRTDTTTASYLDRIQTIKSQLGSTTSGQPIDCAKLVHEPAARDKLSPTPTASPDASTVIDGTYSQSLTAKDLLSAGEPPGDVVPENWGEYRLVLDHGRFAATQRNDQACTWNYGKFTFDGKILELSIADGGGLAPNNAANKPGEVFDYRVSVYQDSMKWSAVPGAVSPGTNTYKPWHRTSRTPSTVQLEKQCMPPAGWNG